MGRRKNTSMYAPYREEIIKLLEDGYTVKQIWRMMFPDPDSGYTYQAILYYVNHSGLRSATSNDGYEHLPRCKECEHFKSIKRHENGRKDMLVCLSEFTEIDRYSVINSPRWCPKRDHKRQVEL